MQTPTEAEKKWIQWCHTDQGVAQGMAAQQAVARMVQVSPFRDPIMMAEIQSGPSLARGYAVACEGAISYLGRIRCQSAGSNPTHLLARVVSDLCRQSLAKGVELVQAILPSPVAEPTELSLQSAFEAAGMIRAARLIQFECCDLPFRHDASPLALAFNPIRLQPFGDMPWQDWCRLVEQTYAETLDVPILNGVRSIEQTLRGYSVGLSKTDLPWWSIYVDQDPIGCLILTDLAGRDCELTYLGLIPQARGHRYSPEIMDYVSNWMMDQGKSRVVLAVDDRNAPALHLYQSFGFEPINAVEAWMAWQPRGR